jgi:hypothetical protein
MTERPLSEVAAAPRRSDRCLSDLELDQLAAGGERSVRTSGHLSSCERCRARLATFQASAAQSGLLISRLLDEAKAEERYERQPLVVAPRRAPLVAAAVMMATAVGGLGVAFLPDALSSSSSSRSADEGVRAKGAAVSMYLRRDGRVARARSGDVFHEGDQLRFVVRTPSGAADHDPDSYFLMLGIEPSGKVMAYYPFGGERSMRVARGTEVQLPDSLVLDGALGDELLLSVFSDAPLDVADVVEALEARGTPYALDRLIDLELPGQAHWTVLRKE